MSKALDEFLALRQASIAGSPTMPEEGKSSGDAWQSTPCNQHMGCHDATYPGGLAAELTAIELAGYFAELLAAHPAAKSAGDRSGLAEYLSRALLFGYGNPECRTHREVPLIRARADGARSLAQCPAGHVTDEAIESHQVLGWACDRCQRVYDARECRLVLQDNTPSPLRGGPETGVENGLE